MLISFIEFLERNLFSCSFKSAIGIECPSCGMQRAFILLLRGDILGSLAMHPALLPYMFTIGFTICHLIFKFKNGARIILIAFISTVVVMMTNYILKMTLS